VKTLLSRRMTAGEHRLQFDGSQLASGIYFYQLKSPRFNQVKKMVLIR